MRGIPLDCCIPFPSVCCRKLLASRRQGPVSVPRRKGEPLAPHSALGIALFLALSVAVNHINISSMLRLRFQRVLGTALLEATSISGIKTWFGIFKQWQWFPSSSSSWSCGCARLLRNRTVVISSGSFLPAKPRLFPCFINFWRQLSVNPSPANL